MHTLPLPSKHGDTFVAVPFLLCLQALFAMGIRKSPVKNGESSHVLHSEILALINFNKKYNLVPWIGEPPYIKCCYGTHISGLLEKLQKLIAM